MKNVLKQSVSDCSASFTEEKGAIKENNAKSFGHLAMALKEEC